ncbi:MAG: endonuclease III domain-containing protein [Solirubrobacterales bacterium]
MNAAGWRPPPKDRVRRVQQRLREVYGVPRNVPHSRPVDELVLTVLSQSTSDRNRDRAYAQLTRTFPDWAAVRDAPPAEVVDAIRGGGLANQKAPRIQAILRGLGSELDLGWLRTADRERALEFLVSLPGVGRKTAACVLLFSYGHPEPPVDVHVGRVGARLGLLPESGTADRLHDDMRSTLRDLDPHEIHINLLRHGRRTCRPDPHCERCDLRRMCPWQREHGSWASPSSKATK